MPAPDPQALQALDLDIGVALYTDGSSWAVDRSGGWAWLALDHKGGEAYACAYVPDTTNNRMEMTAWIKGLNTLADTHGPTVVVVYSDSQYVGFGVRDPNRSRKANADLWEKMDRAVKRHEHVEFVHVKGHTDNEFNNRVDKLAGEIRRKGHG